MPKVSFFEKIGQTCHIIGEGLIRPVDYSVERCSQIYARCSSTFLEKTFTVGLHACMFPCSLMLYMIGEAIDKAGDLFKTRHYHYLQGTVQEKKIIPQKPCSLLSANVCMLPYGIWTWAGLSSPHQRIGSIAQKILESQCDFVCLQEVSPAAGRQLWDRIGHRYAHGFSRIGPMPSNRMNGGLFFASKYPIEKTVYAPLPNEGPIARGVFGAKTHIGWILTAHFKAGSRFEDIALRKKQVQALETLCEELSERGKVPCFVAMDANISRTGQSGDEYSLSGISRKFQNGFEPKYFILSSDTATCSNIAGLALQGKKLKDIEEAYEHIDYILSYRSSNGSIFFKTELIEMGAFSDHKMLTSVIKKNI